MTIEINLRINYATLKPALQCNRRCQESGQTAEQGRSIYFVRRFCEEDT
jgi:hypothetical protein